MDTERQPSVPPSLSAPDTPAIRWYPMTGCRCRRPGCLPARRHDIRAPMRRAGAGAEGRSRQRLHLRDLYARRVFDGDPSPDANAPSDQGHREREQGRARAPRLSWRMTIMATKKGAGEMMEATTRTWLWRNPNALARPRGRSRSLLPPATVHSCATYPPPFRLRRSSCPKYHEVFLRPVPSSIDTQHIQTKHIQTKPSFSTSTTEVDHTWSASASRAVARELVLFISHGHKSVVGGRTTHRRGRR
ncbi:hypothetical protein C8F01DRAFT_799330 [Mycena amicta]|nr:hypothetical protein C8F01DRAFT_799330 [Mycena amicta]